MRRKTFIPANDSNERLDWNGLNNPAGRSPPIQVIYRGNYSQATVGTQTPCWPHFNQCSTGDGLETIGSGNPVYDAVVAIPDENSARAALDSLPGEIHASAKSALIEDSHFVRDAVNDRIRSALGAERKQRPNELGSAMMAAA